MKSQVSTAIQGGIVARRKLLQELTLSQQVQLLEQLFTDMFGDLHTTLQKWAALTGQTAQVDTGYIAQFVGSLVLREPGQGFRGKGDDLVDGSEVKSAANISGVDRPRWNHHMGTVEHDRQARARGALTNSEKYLAVPHLFYLLADRSATGKHSRDIRVRAWLIDAQEDQAWRALFQKYQAEKKGSTYNLQLHPPVGYDDNIVVNTLGNLDFSEVLLFDARITPAGEGATQVHWVKPLPEHPLPVVGRSKPRTYGGRSDRPTNSTEAEDLVADIAVVPDLFPGILRPAQEEAVVEAAEAEADVE